MVVAVFFLEDNEDLRATVADLLSLFGREVVLAKSYAEMVEKGDRVLGCGLAILDINLGPDSPSGIEAYRWLRNKGFAGRIVFLTGHARSHPEVAEAHQIGEALVLEKPIALQRLKRLLEEQ
jgi:FixJ family two-component response regulator